MSVVLGIDAAWTLTQPSGIALVRRVGRRWRCVRVAPSYAQFLADAPIDWRDRPHGSAPDAAALLSAAHGLAGAPVNVVALDLPLATHPITARRPCDNALSAAYAARGLGVHSPSADRPGAISDALRAQFAQLGYPLRGTNVDAGTAPAILEVYPHTALLRLLAADYRVAYKASRSLVYWPDASPSQRRSKLVRTWTTILAALTTKIDGISLVLPRRGPLAALKRFEDALDGLICAYVGIEYLAGRAVSFGDTTSAIWT